MKPINLFEYQNKAIFEENFHELESFLDDIWSKREKVSYYNEQEEIDKVESQRFIQFLHKSNELKSNKYVGVIHFEGQTINLLPKIFYIKGEEVNEFQVQCIHNHVLWWLSYCRKLKFPNYQTSLSSNKGDFLEVLIYLFSKYTKELLANAVFQQYEEIDNEHSNIKGRLNTDAYINENLAKGRWHKVNCTYDSFVIDNKFNRIVKQVCKLLLNVTKDDQNKKNLREILFILDEVSDVHYSANDCVNIQFNPMFKSFETVRDYCYLFLNNCISLNYNNNLKLFAFLLPMEYVFEDFIFGFIDKEIEAVKAKAQSVSKSLAENGTYQLKPDLFLEIGDKNIIADTKYKIVYSDENDPKNGISQTDLYQMLAYAVRFNIADILLFYPDTITHYQSNKSSITILDELANNTPITIKSYQLPIINKAIFENENIENVSLQELFVEVKEKLVDKLKEILILK